MIGSSSGRTNSAWHQGEDGWHGRQNNARRQCNGEAELENDYDQQGETWLRWEPNRPAWSACWKEERSRTSANSSLHGHEVPDGSGDHKRHRADSERSEQRKAERAQERVSRQGIQQACCSRAIATIKSAVIATRRVAGRCRHHKCNTILRRHRHRKRNTSLRPPIGQVAPRLTSRWCRKVRAEAGP